MTEKPHAAPRAAAKEAAREEQTLRERWEAREEQLRERFDTPISRATRLTQRTLGWFPVRVWRHFLQHNGFLLAAGVSYQALFASFAAIYVAFAIAGLWLGGSTEAINGMITVINDYIPGLIAEHGGLVTPEQVTDIATGSTGLLGVTGLIALGTVIWTAIGFVTFTRRAVRDIFAIPPDRRSYILLKAKDLIAAALFGIALVAGSVLGQIATWALGTAFALFGWSPDSEVTNVIARIASVLVSFVVTSLALGGLFRFLTGTTLLWRRIWPGALLGGAAITVLQLGAGLLLSYTPTNPLLATFAIFIGLLLWFRIIGIIVLVAAAWIAVASSDRNLPLLQQTEAERIAAEHRALLLAAQVRLRTAQDARAVAPWYRVWFADKAVRDAEIELGQVEDSAPERLKKETLLE